MIQQAGGLEVGWELGLLLVLLAGLAAVVVRAAALGSPWAPMTAGLRAVVQLAAVSLVIGFVLRSLPWTIAFILLMVSVASVTSSRRITGSARHAGLLLGPIMAGLLPVVLLTLLTGVVPTEPVSLLPIAGILVGGAMSATTLAGRRTCDELIAHFGAYEAALALGFTRRHAVGIVGRRAAGLALVPGQDQTRTVGLVTLPGAFVGVLLGGGSPLEASAAQVLVLVALLPVQAIAAAVTVELIAAGRLPVAGEPLHA